MTASKSLLDNSRFRSGRDEISRFQANPDSSIFRSTDIRGMVLGDSPGLTLGVVNRIGRAFGSFALSRGVTGVVVGHDSRAYSEDLSTSFTLGLLSTGIRVIDIGLATTPMVYFAQQQLGGMGGVSVTASHNPNGWGGLKLSLSPGTSLVEDQMLEIAQLVRNGDHQQGNGLFEEADILADYLQHMRENLPSAKPIHAVIDGGNSISGPVAELALNQLGHQPEAVNLELDWSFPNHEPDPERLDARQQVAEAVLSAAAEIGLSFDGDGDRLGVTDERGRAIWSDQILAILARDVLERHPSSTIVFDVKCSRTVAETITRHGGIPIMWRTGHSHIKAKMRELGAPFAGERSGHFFNSIDYYGFDDGCFTALWLLQILARSGKSMAELVDELPHYVSTPTMHVKCENDATKHRSVERFRAFAQGIGANEIVDIDGVRAEFDDSWLLVRASSNLPALVLVAESSSDTGLEHMYNLLRQGLSNDETLDSKWENDPWA